MHVRERTLGGRYRLEEVIGRGGMSTVYRATDEVLDRIVAVKLLLPALADQDPAYAVRFEREARVVAALASSAVVTVFDTGAAEEGGQYIVMEYVAGRSLDELLAGGHPLPSWEAMRIAERVADALCATHAAGILHRDIKPANVMVADDGNVKVLDFGIARTLGGTSLTQTSSMIGTAAYMAPERALGGPGDARADIYSLGCLLYALLTGRPPFGGEIAAAVLQQQINAVPIPPSRGRGDVPAGLDALVLAMLAKAPEARPQTAAEVRDRLARLSGAPAAAAGAPGTAASADATAAATRPLPRPGPGMALAALFEDHRWRALLMGLATAVVALVAVALLSGGSSPAKHHASSPAARRSPTAANTQPAHTNTAPAAGTASQPPPPQQPAASPHHAHGRHGGGGGGDGGGD